MIFVIDTIISIRNTNNIKPKAEYTNKIKTFLNGSNYNIGVHLRNPTHFIESGSIYFWQYFNIIDRLILQHSNAIIFIASDTDYALYPFIKRYGHRVKYYDNVARSSFDSLLKTYYLLASGNVSMDRIGQLISTQTGQTLHSGEIHTSSKPSVALGKEILLDVLTLAECDEFVGVSSNIALAVSYINLKSIIHIVKGLDNPKTYPKLLYNQ